MEKIYIGVKGSVVALNRTTGEEIWSTKLTGSDFVNVMLDRDLVLASSRGEVCCLDPESGEIRWRNTLPGRGLGLISFAVVSANSGAIAPIAQYQQNQRDSDSAAT